MTKNGKRRYKQLKEMAQDWRRWSIENAQKQSMHLNKNDVNTPLHNFPVNHRDSLEAFS